MRELTSLTCFAATLAMWTQLAHAEPRPMSVCDALNSASDHQSVLIQGNIALTRHQSYIFEGTGREPCPGWPKRFFTAPSAIPLSLGYPGVPVTKNLVREYLDFSQHLRALPNLNQAPALKVAIKGIIIRKPWPLIFRGLDGTYGGWGEGLDGGSAAILVMTSVPTLAN